jgi:beta-hydroxyacyl-ACP dehydratase FabZ
LGKRVVGVKSVTINEPFFLGHFPGHPVMPGVLILEAMAQVGAFLIMRSLNVRPENKIFFFTGIDGARFRRPVIPGDQIRFEVEVLQQRRQMCRMKGTALVDGVVAAEAELSAMLVDRDLPPSSSTPLGV